MPKNRASDVPPTLSVRSSPRKRKLVIEPALEDRTITDEGDQKSDSSLSEEAAVNSTKRSRLKYTAIAHDNNSKSTTEETESFSRKNARPVKDEELVLPSVKQLDQKAGKKKSRAVKAQGDFKVETSDRDQKVLSEAEKVVAKQDGQQEGDEPSKKPIRRRKTKEEKEAEAMPLAARAAGLKMFVGAHVSIAKGVENAITNSLHIGGNAFALFLKSQRKWDNPGLKDENRDAFKQHCLHHQYDQSSHVVPHGSYLVNLASPDKDMSKKSYDAFVDDLHRCEAMGIKYYNFHPGSTNKEPLDEAIGRLAGNLNRALAETKTVTPLLENMAGHGSIIGSRFSDLRDIIAAIKPEFKSRIGICIDTCHAFAAGYDLRTPEAFRKTFQELDEVVGLQYLKAMHINDSKAPFNSHRDLHQNIGAGFLGLRAFHSVMNDVRLQNVPLILETPCDKPDPENPKKTIDDKNVWAREIKLLESLIGMSTESKEFRKLEADLSEQGRADREKMEKSIAARDEKARKKAEKEAIKGQKNISTMFAARGTKRKVSVSSGSSLSEAESDA